VRLIPSTLRSGSDQLLRAFSFNDEDMSPFLLRISCCLLNPYGEIGSGYPSMSMIAVGLSLPILRQKMALSAV
jgi:hypothetical protein